VGLGVSQAASIETFTAFWSIDQEKKTELQYMHRQSTKTLPD